AVFHRGRVRRVPDRARHPVLHHPDLREHPPAQAIRGGWRSVGRPHPGVVHQFAATRIQLCVHPVRAPPRRVGMDEATRIHASARRLQRHPHAEEHRDRRGHRRAVVRLCVRTDLVHLVAGGGIAAGRDRRDDRPQLQLPPAPPHSRRRGAPFRVRQQSGGSTGRQRMNTTAIDTAPPAPADYYCLTEAPPRNGTLLGFWIYLMSDCFIFASLFACYAVLGTEYAGGPTGADVLDLPGLAVNTALLLVSSVVFGFAMLEMARQRKGAM